MAIIHKFNFSDDPETVIRKLNNNFKVLSLSAGNRLKQRILIDDNETSEIVTRIYDTISDETNSRIAADSNLENDIENLAERKATTTTLGMVIVGSGLAVDANGVISLDVQNLDNVGF